MFSKDGRKLSVIQCIMYVWQITYSLSLSHEWAITSDFQKCGMPPCLKY